MFLFFRWIDHKMFTFIESFYKNSYYYTEGVNALREYILDILNTDRGTRPYYPDYGLLVEKYKYSLFTPSLAQNIHADVYFVINSLDNIRITKTNYRMDLANKKLELYYEILLGQEPIGLHLIYEDGGFR